MSAGGTNTCRHSANLARAPATGITRTGDAVRRYMSGNFSRDAARLNRFPPER